MSPSLKRHSSKAASRAAREAHDAEYATLLAERDALRAEVERVTFNYDQQDAYCAELRAKCEALEGALRSQADRALYCRVCPAVALLPRPQADDATTDTKE